MGDPSFFKAHRVCFSRLRSRAYVYSGLAVTHSTEKICVYAYCLHRSPAVHAWQPVRCSECGRGGCWMISFQTDDHLDLFGEVGVAGTLILRRRVRTPHTPLVAMHCQGLHWVTLFLFWNLPRTAVHCLLVCTYLDTSTALVAGDVRMKIN